MFLDPGFQPRYVEECDSMHFPCISHAFPPLQACDGGIPSGRRQKGKKGRRAHRLPAMMGVRGSGRKAKATAKKARAAYVEPLHRCTYYVYAWVVKNGHHNHHHCGRGVITTAVAAPVVTITISRLPAKTYVIAGFQPSLQARKFRFSLIFAPLKDVQAASQVLISGKTTLNNCGFGAF